MDRIRISLIERPINPSYVRRRDSGGLKSEAAGNEG